MEALEATEGQFAGDLWPALPQAAWSDTCSTSQMSTQVSGRIRLASTRAVNHTWKVTLYPTVGGLTTAPMPHGQRML